jgi:hypothetical protein
MALVIPTKGQTDWDIILNDALLELEGEISTNSSKVNGVTVSGTPANGLVLTATSVNTATWTAPSGAGSLLAANNLSDLTNVATARTNLGLGSAAQSATSAFDPAGAATTAQTNANAFTTTNALFKANNLSDLANAATARNNLGLGTAATASSSAFDAAGAATTAQTNAASYTDTQIASEVTRANGAYALKRADVFNVATYGALGDGKLVLDGAIISGQTDLTSPSNPFVLGDVGKWVMLKGAAAAGVTSLIAQITAFVNSGQVTISVAASNTVSGALLLWATDDTVAVQSAINAAVTYAGLHGAATIFFPTGSGLFYGIAGALTTAHAGNSQLYLPPLVTTGNKSNLIFLGVGNGSILQHWEQLTPQFSGSTLVSFGVFASSGAQTTSINNGGNACVIGGPSQPGGYGVAPGIFSNMGVTFKDMSILTTYSSFGLSYSAGDMTGVSNCNLFDFAYGTTGTVPHNDFASPNSFANGLSIGWLMPANGNNDNCAISNVTCHGGFTFGFFATEHTTVDNMRILYCWSGFCPVGVYFGGVGATHAFWINQISVEACTHLINIVGAGSAGIGPFLNIDQLDTETGAPSFTDRNSGAALNAALGNIRLTGLYTAANTTVSASTGLKIVDGQKAFPVTAVSANYTVSVLDEVVLIDATSAQKDITLISAAWTPNVYTFKKTDSSANPVVIHTVNSETIQGVGAPATTYTLAAQGNSVTIYPARVSSAWNWYTKS